MRVAGCVLKLIVKNGWTGGMQGKLRAAGGLREREKDGAWNPEGESLRFKLG